MLKHLATLYTSIHAEPFRKKDAINKEINTMLEQGIIRENSRPWTNPVPLVPRKNGELRFCVDYRNVNAVTIKIDTTSDFALGGILCQEEENGIECPIQYISAQLTGTQRKWATIKRECWAMLYCLDKMLFARCRIHSIHRPQTSIKPYP